MNQLTVSPSPHITKPRNTTRRIMAHVLISLIPCVAAAIVLYGYHVAINLLVCAAACFASELLFDLTIRKDFTKNGVKTSSVWNLSCFVTATLLALNLPSTLNVWGLGVETAGKLVFSLDTVLVCILGSVFAIVIAKELFGGIGKNFANPAVAGRIFLFLCFGAAFASVANVFDATTSATWLSAKTDVSGTMLVDMLLGKTGSAAVGETCAIAVLIGYVYLCAFRIIDWKLPLSVVGSAFCFALLFDGAVNGLSGMQLLTNAAAHVLSGGLLFGAVFMATDYATSPNTNWGRFAFGVGIGLITVLIRCFASYPEGMSFAILIMNVATPLLDKAFRPLPYGMKKSKKEGK